MREYCNLTELWDDYASKNELAKSFLSNETHCCLSVPSLTKFAKIYEENKGRGAGAKFSERVFSYWIAKELFEYNVPLKVRIDDEISIELSGEIGSIPKKIDFSFKRGSGPRVYIEFKCNIDMVEKDLYKFYLMKRDDDEIVTSIFIWERSDNWEYAKGGPSQYARLLEDAQASGFLDRYFYFPIYDRNEESILDGRIELGIAKLSEFLHGRLTHTERANQSCTARFSMSRA